jgi:hypothetical protein
MVEVISVANFGMTIIALEQKSVFYSGGIVPNAVESLVRMDHIAGGMIRMVAKKDLMLMVDGLWHDPCTGADHVFFMRDDRANEGAGSLLLERPYRQTELCKALIAAQVPHMESVGGFDCIPVYGDEIAVAGSQGESGYGWIIKRSEIRKYLRSGSPQDDPDRLRRLTIWHEIHLDKNGEKFPVVRIEGWSTPQIPNDVTLWDVTEYTVLFNEASRVVQRIYLTNAISKGIACDRSPIRGVAIGKKLPANLAIKRR